MHLFEYSKMLVPRKVRVCLSAQNNLYQILFVVRFLPKVYLQFSEQLHKLQLKNRLLISIIALISRCIGWAFPCRQLTASCFLEHALAVMKDHLTLLFLVFSQFCFLSWKRNLFSSAITINRWTYLTKTWLITVRNPNNFAKITHISHHPIKKSDKP